GGERRADLGEEEQPATGCRPGSETLRPVGVPDVPHLPGHGVVQPRCARPERRGREEPGHPVPGQPPEMPVVREPRFADAVVRVARRPEPETTRRLPGVVKGRQIAAMMCACASSWA